MTHNSDSLGSAIARRHLRFVAGGPMAARGRRIAGFLATRLSFAARITQRLTRGTDDAELWSSVDGSAWVVALVDQPERRVAAVTRPAHPEQRQDAAATTWLPPTAIQSDADGPRAAQSRPKPRHPRESPAPRRRPEMATSVAQPPSFVQVRRVKGAAPVVRPRDTHDDRHDVAARRPNPSPDVLPAGAARVSAVRRSMAEPGARSATPRSTQVADRFVANIHPHGRSVVAREASVIPIGAETSQQSVGRGIALPDSRRPHHMFGAMPPTGATGASEAWPSSAPADGEFETPLHVSEFMSVNGAARTVRDVDASALLRAAEERAAAVAADRRQPGSVIRQPLSIDELVDRVVQQLSRRIAVEAERKGVPWLSRS